MQKTLSKHQRRLLGLAEVLNDAHPAVARFLVIQAVNKADARAMTAVIDISGGDDAFLRRYDA